DGARTARQRARRGGGPRPRPPRLDQCSRRCTRGARAARACGRARSKRGGSVSEHGTSNFVYLDSGEVPMPSIRDSFLRSPVVAALGSLMLLPSCRSATGGDPRTDPPLVRTAIVQSTASALTRSFTGTVAARVQSDLGFRVSGKVLERLVSSGQ